MKKLRLYFSVLVAAVLCLSLLAPRPVLAEGNEYAYVGGVPIGIVLDIGGLLVEGVTGVETEYGTAYPEGLDRGDIIKSIDGIDVTDCDDINGLLSSEPARLEIVRGGRNMEIDVTPIVEAYTKKPKLGVKIKDKLYGVGTVSFVRDNGRYAALGHEIYDAETGTHLDFAGGKVCACKIVGIKQGDRSEAGAILASIVSDTDYGSIDCNNNFGIAGNYKGKQELGERLPLASRSEVRPGYAQIRTTVDDKPQLYDIEIIKATKQTGRREKGIIFRITDKNLLKLTGGVVRGMSGSPIIQNGKIIAAVTHVMLNDFTKGYALYADCLND